MHRQPKERILREAYFTLLSWWGGGVCPLLNLKSKDKLDFFWNPVRLKTIQMRSRITFYSNETFKEEMCELQSNDQEISQLV